MRFAFLATLLFILGTDLQASDLTRIAGTVVGIDREKRTLFLKHEGIENILEPGVLEARVGQADLSVDYTGRLIDAGIRQIGSQWWLENIWPGPVPETAAMEELNRRLHAETATRGKRAVRVTGDFLPNFALFDQEGRVVQFRQFRGQYLVVNFIFTRCPSPTMCPASTARMVELQQRVIEQGWDEVHQLTITLDPAYDTPGILKYYAETRGIDLERFSLMTGSEEAVRDLLKVFGILTYDEEGVLNHTMVTVLVDPNGKIIHRREGSRWSVAEFVERLQPLFAKQS